MNWTLTYDVALTLVALLLVCWVANLYLGREHIRRVMHAACRKSESDGNDYCRIPRNQVIEMMGWQTVYELRPAGYEFKGKPSFRHPSSLSATRRRKLRK